MVVLEINQISFLKQNIIPIFTGQSTGASDSGALRLQSAKVRDFLDWVTLVNIYYFGYHLLPEGVSLVNEIKSRMNKFRLSTCSTNAGLSLSDCGLAATNSSVAPRAPAAETINSTTLGETISLSKFSYEDRLALKISNLFSLPAPYEIRSTGRFLRNTDRLVSEKFSLVSIDAFSNKLFFSSISTCSKALRISRSVIKKCLLTGEIYNGLRFVKHL